MARLFQLVILLFCSPALADDACSYVDASGQRHYVNSKRKAPARYRSSCEKTGGLVRPDKLTLDENTRRQTFESELGTIDLRWAKGVERLFGRTPLRAMKNSARTVNRALKRSGFPKELRSLNIPWKVVFMDKNVPGGQIPSNLRQNCHPGWMTPPGNVYIVAERVAVGCSGGKTSTSVAVSRLEEVLVHEMAHAIEYQLTKGRAPRERFRSEGFATWFEVYGAQFSSDLSKSKLWEKTLKLARQSVKIQGKNFKFNGSAQDYARASTYFFVIESVKGVSGITSLYKEMSDNGLSFFAAAEKRFGWSKARMNEESLRLISNE